MEQIRRSTYGEIINPADHARLMVVSAAKAKKIPASYDNTEWSGSRRRRYIEGNALHHEIYDYTDTRVIVCCRETESNKYGTKTTSKTYYLLQKRGTGVSVTNANKALVAKAAKTAVNLGDVIAVCTGKKPLKLKASGKRIGYKLVKSTPAGFVSVWDDSDWVIGKTRTERATNDHSGGFYCYRNINEALAAASKNDVFGSSRGHRKLTILEVETSGRVFQHDSETATKICTTRIKPLREICSVI